MEFWTGWSITWKRSINKVWRDMSETEQGWLIVSKTMQPFVA